MYTVECGISGVILGSSELYREALEIARTHRFEMGYNVVWDYDNERIAQVWADGNTWERT